MTTFNTRDIGIAIRDFMEGNNMSHFEEKDGELTFGLDDYAEVKFVDISDPDNPTIHLGNGQQFICRIFAA